MQWLVGRPGGSWRRGAWFAAAALCLTACGGGGGGGGAAGPDLSGGPARPSGNPSGSAAETGTARFSVDVASGKVDVLPLAGGTSRGGRAAFAGSAVGFTSSVLLDQPGSAGLRVLHVSLTNHWGVPIGQAPDGTVMGLRVHFGPITNLAAGGLDLRSQATVSTVAGPGSGASTDGPLASADFAGPDSLATDRDGNVLAVDGAGNKVRWLSGGSVTTLAGGGAYSSLDGVGYRATFNVPQGCAYNAADRSHVVTERGGHRLRRVTADGNVSTIAGTARGFADGPGTTAAFNNPWSATCDDRGVIYVADTGNNRIRSIGFVGGDRTLAANYSVLSVAGSGTAATVDGVGGLGTLAGAAFNAPSAVCIGPDGALYITEYGGHCVRRFDLRAQSGGTLTTIAGSAGHLGSADGPGDAAGFSSPVGILSTRAGLVVADYGNHRLRLVTLQAGADPTDAHSWIVRTLAGTTGGFSNGPATSAQLWAPMYPTLDPAGAILVADKWQHAIRKVTVTGGLDGLQLTGSPGGSGSATPVRLSNPDGLLPAGTPFIDYQWADLTPPSASRGRSVLAPGASTPAQDWTFVVPQGVAAFSFAVTVEAATSAPIAPEAVSGAGSPRVSVRTLAGSSTAGFVDGVLAEARFNGAVPACDRFGHVYLADTQNNAIRRIGTDGRVSTVAGVGSGAAAPAGTTDGSGLVARFSAPAGIACDADGLTLYVSDTGNHTIRRLSRSAWSDPADPAQWTVSTIAGTATTGGFADGRGDAALLAGPQGLALAAGGSLFVAEAAGSRVRRIRLLGGDAAVAANYQVSLLAGSPTGSPGLSDATGAAAQFRAPRAVAVDLAGTVYVADTGNHQLRKVTPDGTVSLLAGSPTGAAGYADATGSSALLSSPGGLAVDRAGYVYVADLGNHRVRRVDPTGKVATVAGTGTAGGTDGTGDTAQLDSPYGLALTGWGDLFVSDGSPSAVRVRQIQVLATLAAGR